MTRAISAPLLAAQQGDYPPYINLIFHNRDDTATQPYSLALDSTNRIMHIEHHELLYDDYAFIVLRNNDLSVIDLRGWWVEIGYGADTTDFGGSGVEWELTARLWVANQHSVSAPGTQVTTLALEGIWRRMARHLVRTKGSFPLNDDEPFTVETVYGILKYLIETDLQEDRPYMAATLDALASGQDDGIINTLIPYFEFNQYRHESSLEIQQRALNLTKCFLRARKTLNFEVRFPQDSDAVDATYYSDQVPYFHEFVESNSVLVPNFAVFYGNYSEEFGWDNKLITIIDDVAANEERVVAVHLLPNVTEAGDLVKYAQAYAQRIKYRRVAGRLIIRHDARLEIHDRVQILDSRGL